MRLGQIFRIEAVNHVVAGIVVTLVANGALLLVFIDPFYNVFWIKDHASWILLPVVLVPLLLATSSSMAGLALVTVLGVLDVVGFALIFEKFEWKDDPWPFVAWLLHLLFIPLFAACCFGAWVVIRRIVSAKRRKPRTQPPAV